MVKLLVEFYEGEWPKSKGRGAGRIKTICYNETINFH